MGDRKWFRESQPYCSGDFLTGISGFIVALRKGKSEIIIGTILGSNVFNGAAIGASMGLFGHMASVKLKFQAGYLLSRS